MSLVGKYTPLGLNVLGGFLNNTGLTINEQSKLTQGVWEPGQYVQGTVSSTTVLDRLTAALPLIYDAYQGGLISEDTYIKATTIGYNSIPALGNSRSAAFIRTYPGYSDPYPPQNYPSSSIQYAWLKGWQRTGTNPQYIQVNLESDEYWRYGFLGCIARQAYYEIFEDTTLQYYSFAFAWQQHYGWMNNINSAIGSFNNTKSFLLGNYTNINDLDSSDVTGVTTSVKLFGSDLIALGKIFTLANIHKFGTPSDLLLTLQQNNALSEALRFALLYELTTQELNDILNNVYPPSTEQERKIYIALGYVSGSDLDELRTMTNCSTSGFRTACDFLDPKYLFPTSYQTLTIPTYSGNTLSSKLYSLIYKGGSVNSGIQNWGEYLKGILPEDVALACGAFSMSMQQIKNVSTMHPEKFAQAISNLELVNKNLPLVNSGDGVPGDVATANFGLKKLAMGSGPGQKFRMCDFFGSSSGQVYLENYQLITPLLSKLGTPNLHAIYQNIYDAVSNGAANLDSVLQSLIAQANAEISGIQSSNPEESAKLNRYWNTINSQLTIEQRAIPLSVPEALSFITELDRSDFYSLVKSVDIYAQETEKGGAALTLEGMCNLRNLPGQSLVALMREARNAARMGLAGGELDNDVTDEIGGPQGVVNGSTTTPLVPPPDSTDLSQYPVVPLPGPSRATAEVVVEPVSSTNGYLRIAGFNITNGGSGYDPCEPPEIKIWSKPSEPLDTVQLETTIDANTGSIIEIRLANPSTDVIVTTYTQAAPPQLYIPEPPGPTRSGKALFPGSQAGSEYVELVPNNLITSISSSNTVSEAIGYVQEL